MKKTVQGQTRFGKKFEFKVEPKCWKPQLPGEKFLEWCLRCWYPRDYRRIYGRKAVA